MTDYDREAIASAFESTDLVAYGPDPGGFDDWLPALTAWAVDEGDRLDPAKLAEKIAMIWEVGGLVEKELAGRFRVRATDRSTFPYHDGHGELQAGVVGRHELKLLSEDPREVACAIAAAVVKEARRGENMVLFRRLLVVNTLYVMPARREYVTNFGLALVA